MDTSDLILTMDFLVTLEQTAFITTEQVDML